MKRLVAMAAMVFACITGISNVHALERGTIAEDANSVTPLLNGQVAPKTTLKMADGSPVSLQALTMQKPSIVLFYRGGWCPYCNEQLAQLKDIEKDLVDMGYQILAISPESPARLQEQKLETQFLVTLLSDDKLDTIREFGVGFYVDTMTDLKYKTYGIDLTKDESGKSVLPAPAIFMLDKKGKVLFSYVNPDYKVRPSAELVLSVAKALKKEM
ncbi:peroxiredoxin-like family protein [Alteromonas sp. PRIM-21]|uniref:peroxiredoxin-like family protein n=1 Tax=Alteromonas sp. PRIM-21 TaxID=1454978 RepID=UPI0022B960B5|nr:peroxiredoxin-like family protein [Alteromonas sp. PRIM-21]MCZ8529083.1 AhpC/TSA family protein [Alteromonas sp. PRIM-21]